MTLVCIQLLYLAVVTSDFDKIKLVNQILAGKEQPEHSARYLLYERMIFVFESINPLYVNFTKRKHSSYKCAYLCGAGESCCYDCMLYLSFQ